MQRDWDISCGGFTVREKLINQKLHMKINKAN